MTRISGDIEPEKLSGPQNDCAESAFSGGIFVEYTLCGYLASQHDFFSGEGEF